MKLTLREQEVLNELDSEWSRPMDVGGRDGSDHSRVLKSLARKGVIERHRRNTLQNAFGSSRGSYMYRIGSIEMEKRQLAKIQKALEAGRLYANLYIAPEEATKAELRQVENHKRLINEVIESLAPTKGDRSK